MAEVTDIITKLLERTNENKVSWQTTADEDTFIAVVGDTSTLVSAYEGRLDLMAGKQEVRFRILNREGREIERYDTSFTILNFERLKDIDNSLAQLYAKARRFALGVEDQLDELLKALEE